MSHDEDCPRPFRSSCRAFSTDGTYLGAEIAHAMGTMDEQEIAEMASSELTGGGRRVLTGMEEEQADWEAEE